MTRALCALLLGLVLVQGFEKLDLLSPPGLHNAFKNGVDERPAFFGIPPYGASVSGRVVTLPVASKSACQPLNQSSIDLHNVPPGVTWQQLIDAGVNIIVMVHRGGGCTFVTKVRHAQQIGAAAVIVVDNTNSRNIPYMADDKTGRDIEIPSVLIHQSDGDVIEQYVASEGNTGENSTVLAAISWGVPNPDNRVEWRFWTSSYEPDSVDFKETFWEADKALADSAEFAPHFFTLNGHWYGCIRQDHSQPCGKQCTNYGRYCAVDPEGDRRRGLDGEDVIMENVRQYCLWQHLNTTGETYKWWYYVNRFLVKCGQSAFWESNTLAKQCSKEVLDEIGIPHNIVFSCVDNSGMNSSDPFGDNQNWILEKMLTQAQDDGIYWHPAVVINDSPYRGGFHCAPPVDSTHCGVLGAICAGFADSRLVPVCNCDATQVVDGSCTNMASNSKGGGGGVSIGAVMGIIIVVVLVLVLGFWIYNRKQRRDMRLDLDRILQSYMPIDDTGSTRQPLASGVDSSTVGAVPNYDPDPEAEADGADEPLDL